MVAARKVDLLVIVGPTASGKSRLAMQLAKKFSGEIIAADSRTIYKGLNIGTAKPSSVDRRQIKHWGIDMIEPGQNFSAAQFKGYALAKIEEIQKRAKLPIIVGGTGLYIDGVLFDYEFIKGSDDRAKLSAMSAQALQRMIIDRGYTMPRNNQNKRHLIRALERQGRVGSRSQEIREGTLLVGLMPPDSLLRRQISSRADTMFESGIVGEAAQLINRYGEQTVSQLGIIYKISASLLSGEINEDTAKQLFKTADWQYAKRQKTWFKRNKFIQWFSDPAEAFISVSQQLNT